MNRASSLSDRSVNRYVGGVIWLAGVAATISYVAFDPYFSDDDVEPHVFAVGVYAAALLFAVAAGTLTARRVGLGATVIEAFVRHTPLRAQIEGLLDSTALGIALGILALLHGFLGMPTVIGHASGSFSAAVDWDAMNESLFAGVTEEIFFRFGLLSVLAWVFSYFLRRRGPDDRQDPLPGSLVVRWIRVADLWFQPPVERRGKVSRHALQAAALVSGLAFALFHTEQIAQGGMGDVAMRTLHGLVFGGLYVRHGLEAAVAAHASYDMSLSIMWNALT
jgi:CAAX prenyl protease-like protein